MNHLIKTIKSSLALILSIALPPWAMAQDTNHVQARLSQLEKQLNLLQESPLKLNTRLAQRFDVSALVELETFIEDTNQDNNQDSEKNNKSDTRLATIEVAIQSKLNPYIEGQVILLHEDGSEQDIAVDEGFLTLSAPDSSFSLKAGKQVIAFGNFESHLITGPLTLELAETKDTALTVQAQTKDYYAVLYVFNGANQTQDSQTQDSNDEIKQSGAQLGLINNSAHNQWHLGAGYISSLAESEIFTDFFKEQASDYQLQGNTPAASVHGSLSMPHWHFLGEYIFATQSFHEDDLAFNEKAAQPSAYHVEIARDFVLLNKAMTIALAQQGSQQALALELPKQRFLVALSHDVYKQTSLAVEYMQAKDYAINKGGSGNTQRILSMQLAARF